MNVITLDNYAEARQALRDIVFLYVDLAESYGGFGHGADQGSFDPFRFVDAQVEVPSGYTSPVDLDLLRQGSAVALLCSLYDLWSEVDNVKIDIPWVEELRTALDQRRFRYCPDIEHVMLEVLERHSRSDDLWLLQQVIPIYERYVRTYFVRLASFHLNC